MLNADLRLPSLRTPALPERTGSAVAGASTGFSALYRQLNSEVSRFIEQGSAASPAGAVRNAGAAAAALSPEGAWRQLESTGVASEAQQAFVREILPMAEQAAAQLGVSAEVLAAHAALESGWGSRPIRREDGSDSNNLFGIKAGASWRGEVAEVSTTEYAKGRAEQRVEGFRSYASVGEAFRDFAQLLQGNSRYRAALQTGSDVQAYAQALQKGGYATDPAYADKLARVAAQIGRSAR